MLLHYVIELKKKNFKIKNKKKKKRHRHRHRDTQRHTETHRHKSQTRIQNQIQTKTVTVGSGCADMHIFFLAFLFSLFLCKQRDKLYTWTEEVVEWSCRYHQVQYFLKTIVHIFFSVFFFFIFWSTRHLVYRKKPLTKKELLFIDLLF